MTVMLWFSAYVVALLGLLLCLAGFTAVAQPLFITAAIVAAFTFLVQKVRGRG